MITHVHTREHVLKFRSQERMLAFFGAVTATEVLSQAERWSFLQRIAWRDMAEPPAGPAGEFQEDRMVDARLFRELRNGSLWRYRAQEEGLVFCEEFEVEELVDRAGIGGNSVGISSRRRRKSYPQGKSWWNTVKISSVIQDG